MRQAHIRPYLITDEQSVLKLLALNTPRWFDPSERADFVRYLAHEREDYFVLEADKQLIGCGGINYIPQERAARISWDMLHPHYQGQGYGSRLLHYRLGLLRTKPEAAQVIVRTSQLVYSFYAKAGFQLFQTITDYWAPGYDLYEMHLSIRK